MGNPIKKNLFLRLILLIALMLSAENSFSAVFNVSTEAELQIAVATANSNGEDDIINITSPGSSTITSTLYVTTRIEFRNTSGGTVALSGDDLRRVFWIYDGGNATISDITIRDGYTDTDSYAGWAGGGILVIEGTLTMNNCILTGNYAYDFGGALQVFYNSTAVLNNCDIVDNYANDYGGGFEVWVNSSVTLNNCTVEYNESYWGGGLDAYTNCNLSIYNCTISNNVGVYGGGVFEGGGYGNTVTIDNTIISDNDANYGGGIASEVYDPLNPQTSINSSTISNNEAVYFGGGILNMQSKYRLNNVTISGNNVIVPYDYDYYGGGGISNAGSMTIDQCIINDNNSGHHGGGIICWWNGDDDDVIVPLILTITNTTIDGNYAEDGGGGMSHFSGAFLVNIHQSTISNNWADDKNGGGIHSGHEHNGTVNITNSTISGNHADERGGGVFNRHAKFNLINVTITDNEVTSGPTGGGIFNDYPLFKIKNCLIAENYDVSGGYPDIAGDIASQGFNLIGNVGNENFSSNTNGDRYGDPNGTTTPNASAFESATAINPMLYPLADNGGYTRTHALQYYSPAIDNGTSTAAPYIDQRGMSRQAPRYDIGSYEYGTFIPTLTEWAAIALGGFLLIFGGWFIWRKLS